MDFFKTSLIATLILLSNISASYAHNVWAHTIMRTPEATVDAFHQSGKVYHALVEAMHVWDTTSAAIEEGVIAEFEHKLNNTPLKPRYYKETLYGLEVLSVKLETLAETLDDAYTLINGGDIDPDFNEALTKLLADDKTIVRLSLVGARYSDISGKAAEQETIDGISGIFGALQDDLSMLRTLLKDVTAATREAIPLAEKGEFAEVMLSGRNAFGDKMPQFTDMISAYERLYVQLSLSTIAGTMQVYPKGFKWLR